MSALAHDIKTPLTIVRGNAELLSETELTPEQKNNVTYVLNGTTQIQSYVKQLIDVTKSWNCSDVTYTTVRLEDFSVRGVFLQPLLNWYKINLGIHYNIVRKLRKE